jgi:hypothetical protein
MRQVLIYQDYSRRERSVSGNKGPESGEARWPARANPYPSMLEDAHNRRPQALGKAEADVDKVLVEGLVRVRSCHRLGNYNIPHRRAC